VQIFFPDPWHKKRHHKRRLVQAPFLTLVAQKLKTGGTLHIATDWKDYAEHILTVMASNTHFENRATDGCFVPRPDYRPVTKFEKRGLRLGHGVWDLVFTKR
jgi:tRNA (guanine-N7-)-methyltransferase